MKMMLVVAIVSLLGVGLVLGVGSARQSSPKEIENISSGTYVSVAVSGPHNYDATRLSSNGTVYYYSTATSQWIPLVNPPTGTYLSIAVGTEHNYDATILSSNGTVYCYSTSTSQWYPLLGSAIPEFSPSTSIIVLTLLFTSIVMVVKRRKK